MIPERFQKFLITTILLFPAIVFGSEESAQSFTLDGRFYSDSLGTLPLTDLISLKVQILNPAQNCIIYEETQIVDTRLTSGYYTVYIGQKAGPPTGKRSTGDSNNSMAILLSNTTSAISGKLLIDETTVCTYAPLSGDSRFVKFTMTPNSDNIARTTTTNLLLNAVPLALVAERAENLRGFAPSSFLQVNNTTAALTQANLESVFTSTGMTRLNTLLSVPPTNYVQSTANGSAAIPSVAVDPAAGLAAGQIWYNSVSNTFKYYDAGSASVKSLANTTGGSFLPLAGGTLTGSLVAQNISGASTASGSLWLDSTTDVTKGNIILAPFGGNVGLGTTSPSAKLHIVGQDANSNSALPDVLNIAGATNLGTGAGSSINLTAGGGTAGSTISIGGGNWMGGSVTIKSGDSHGGGSGSVSILGGNGTGGGNQTGGTINITGGTTTGWPYDGPSIFINGGAKNSSGADGNVILTNLRGNVGVGVTSPASKLDVAGEVKFGSTGITCAAGTAGAVRYNSGSLSMEFCNGSAWTVMQSSACADATPDAFAFSNNSNAIASTLTASDIVQINGITCSISVKLQGNGSPQARICADASCTSVIQDWTSNVTSIANGQYLQVRTTSDSVGGSTFPVTVFAGSSATTWLVTTAGGDCVGTTPAIGTVCADGSIYAGQSPDGNVKMFTTRCDIGQSWNGTNCASGRTTITWNNGSTNWTTTGITSFTTGKSNSAALNALSDAGAPYSAAQYCEALNENGQSDWYLPALSELNVLFANKSSIRNFEDVNGSGYFSSSEYSAMNGMVYYQVFSTGLQRYAVPGGGPAKNAALLVRCVRR